MMDLSKLSLKELRKLGNDVEKAIGALEARRRKDARAAMDKVAKEYGVSVEDILGADKPKATRKRAGAKAKKPAKKGAPKFRNPDAPDQTWTGKGRRPAWFIAAIEAGKSEKDLAI